MSTTTRRGLRIIILLLIFTAHYSVVGKSFAPCELATELIQVHNFTLEEARNLICIAQKLSNLNTNVIVGDKYGLFQINKSYCDRNGDAELSCDVKCDDLLNEDIRDDIHCVRKVLSSRGLSAWRFDKRQGCRKIFRNFDNRCMKHLPTLKNQTAKQCEHAKRLTAEYQISKLDALVWACISSMDDGGDDEAQTKTGNVNEKFQAQKFNDLTCVKKHDIECAIKKRKQAGLSGNDYRNWSAFERSCKNVNEGDVKKCFEEVLVVTPRSKYTTSTEISIVIEDSEGRTYQSFNEGRKIVENTTEGRKVIKNSTTKIPPQKIKNDEMNERSSIGSTDEGYSKIRIMKNDKVDKNTTSSESLFKDDDPSDSTTTEKYLSTKNPEMIRDDSTKLKEIPLLSVKQQETMTQANFIAITENIVSTTTKALAINSSEVLPSNDVTATTTTLDTSSIDLRTLSSTTSSIKTADSYETFDFDDDWLEEQTMDDVTGKYEVSKEYENIDKCHLAKNIKESGRLPINLIPILLCIAENESHLNVSSKRVNNNTIRFGLFQIDDQNYCNTNDKINECDVLCEHLNDDQFDNDWECVNKILEKEGLKYWHSYSKNCSNISENSLDYCYIQSTTTHRPFAVLSQSEATSTTTLKTTSTEKYENDDEINESFSYSAADILRKFELCELSQQLHLTFNIPLDDLGHIVCIANQNRLTILKPNISEALGLFSINETLCNSICSLNCSDLTNEDISDDVGCAYQIYIENGLSAWNLDADACSNFNSKILHCIDDGKFEIFIDDDFGFMPSDIDLIGRNFPEIYFDEILTTKRNEIETTTESFEDENTQKYLSQEKASKSVVENQEKNLRNDTTSVSVENTTNKNLIENSKTIPTVEIEKSLSQVPSESSSSYFTSIFEIFTTLKSLDDEGTTSKYKKRETSTKNILDQNIDKCNLARSIKGSEIISQQLIAKFVCIAEHESKLDHLMINKHENYSKFGLFQIDDHNYCNTMNEVRKCDILCAHLNDDQFSNDLECVKKIYEEEGFNYWPSYSQHCAHVDDHELDYCYAPHTTTHQPFITTITGSDEIVKYHHQNESTTTEKSTTNNEEVKLTPITFCGLVQSLHKTKTPLDNMQNLMCIAVEKNPFGVRELGYGLFAIKNEHCDKIDGKCQMKCSSLLDEELEDDVLCAENLLVEKGLGEWNLSKEICKPYKAMILNCYLQKQFETTTTPIPPMIDTSKIIEIINKTAVEQTIQYDKSKIIDLIKNARYETFPSIAGTSVNSPFNITVLKITNPNTNNILVNSPGVLIDNENVKQIRTLQNWNKQQEEKENEDLINFQDLISLNPLIVTENPVGLNFDPMNSSQNISSNFNIQQEKGKPISVYEQNLTHSSYENVENILKTIEKLQYSKENSSIIFNIFNFNFYGNNHNISYSLNKSHP